jgi:hypothetical protein
MPGAVLSSSIQAGTLQLQQFWIAMKHSFVLIFFALFPFALNAQSVTFTARPIATGVSVERLDSLGMSLDVSMDGSDEVLMTQTNTEFRHYTLTVLEADEKRMNKARLDVHKAWEKGMALGGAQFDLAIQGKSYSLAFSDTGLYVEYADGTPAPDAECSLVRNVAGKREENALVSVLDGRTMSVGDTLSLMDELLESFLAFVGNENAQIRQVTMKLTDVRMVQNMRCAVFDMFITLSSAQSQVDMDLDMIAEGVIAEESLWPLSISMDGTMRGSTSQQGMLLFINGTVKGKKAGTYKRP